MAAKADTSLVDSRSASAFFNLVSKDNHLRLLYPIRNPLDCAVSNTISTHVRLLPGLNINSTKESALEAILNEFLWFLEIEKEMPEKCLHFYAFEVDKAKFEQIANFLDIDSNEEWTESAIRLWKIDQSKYEHNEGFKELYKKLVIKKFASFPDEQIPLLKFIEM